MSFIDRLTKGKTAPVEVAEVEESVADAMEALIRHRYAETIRLIDKWAETASSLRGPVTRHVFTDALLDIRNALVRPEATDV